MNNFQLIADLFSKQQQQSPKLNVVVIGGSSGIGKAIVARFAQAEHRVLFTYYSNAQGAAEIKKRFWNVDYCFLDQGDLNSVEAFGNVVCEWLKSVKSDDGSEGRVDILINNAALGSATVIPYIQSKLAREESSQDSHLRSPSLRSSTSTFDVQAKWNSMSSMRKKAMEDEALMRVNALGPLWITETLMPMMRCPMNMSDFNSNDMDRQSDDERPPSPVPNNRNYATIVFIGSVGGSVGVFPEYRASDLMSKAAVTYLSKHLAAEHVRSHIDVFCLSPGATLTDMFRKSTLETCTDPSLFTNQMPKKRLIEPEELADAVFSLSTEKWARVFHGAVLDASLGLGVRSGLQTESMIERGIQFLKV